LVTLRIRQCPVRAQRLQDWTRHRLGGRNPGGLLPPTPTLRVQISRCQPTVLHTMPLPKAAYEEPRDALLSAVPAVES